MKKLTYFAPIALLALAACGSSTDASEDATADTVEIPADEAMSGMPDPVADPAAGIDAPVDDMAPVETTEDVGDAAEAAAMDAAAAAEAATQEAEASME
jgi:hypothetical protein